MANEKMLRNLLIALVMYASTTAVEFEDNFKNCHPDKLGFDACVRKGLNAIQPYFKTGLSKYNVLPLDPSFIKEITVTRGVPNFGFTLTLRNVTEIGWTLSKVTKFISELRNYKIVYTQSFPKKGLTGNYEFKAALFSSTITNKGKFTLNLHDLMQTTTVTKVPGQKLRAEMDVESIGDLELHITNLLFGKKYLENILDMIINNTWQPSFMITRRLINELVSIAFTDIFDKSFRNFPFEQIFKSNQSIS
ncbi:circadian clock-controlled protein daywake [Cataglyphis hispanica]|uniref:circadian clock-controlled protein daywake n=1 Tax=Cataglyphis hispanica TaxID=1086592 RepID=UPI0021805D82|nr:circadian clock-controlled protein daywake [Cataglyphis hispanica]